MRTLLLLVAWAAIAVCGPPIPHDNDLSSSSLQQLVAETERKTESERSLNECFAMAYSVMVHGRC